MTPLRLRRRLLRRWFRIILWCADRYSPWLYQELEEAMIREGYFTIGEIRR